MEWLTFTQNVHRHLIQHLLLIHMMVTASADTCLVKNQVANCSARGLTSVPSTLPENITTLLMADNKLVDIAGFAFKKYAHLKHLDLSNNQIKRLNNNSFYGLTSLQSLQLERNHLNLSRNAYPALCFSGLVSLQRLLIGNNVAIEWFLDPQDSFYYPDEAIGQLEALEELSVDGLPNAMFGVGFCHLHSLTYLDFKLCYINYVEEGMFVNTPNITFLSMSHCHIFDVHKESFAKLPHIDTLDLSGNTEVGLNVTHIFHGLRDTQIRVLMLSSIYPPYSICVVIPSDCLRYLFNTSIKELYLNHNDIRKLEPGALDYFPPSLEIISLRDNKFTFGHYIFELNKLTGLRRIDLSDNIVGHSNFPLEGNGIYSIPWIPSFPLPPNLEDIVLRNMIIHAEIPSVYFSKNRLRSLDASQNGVSFWRGPVYGLKNLETLDLSSNYCSKVIATFFNSFMTIRILNVSNNYLGDALKDLKFTRVFSSLTKLEVLDLSANRFRILHPTFFKHNRNLKYLNLSQNAISNLDLDVGKINLTMVNLQMNEIRYIAKSTRDMFDAMDVNNHLTVDLSDNPLDCSCDHLDFLLWILKTKVNLQNVGTYTCVNEFGKRMLLDKGFIKSKKETCKSYAGVVIGGLCSVVFFLSVSVVGLVYRYRWRIKYLYYIVRDRYNFHRGQDDGERQFMFDAFISYANEDLVFVDTLINNLEGQGKRLVVHHRDFRPGEPIGANIVNAIQTSRHTVLILSGSFLESNWCRYEFEMARMEAVYDSRSVLVVVKIEDVSSAAVPRELLYLMRSDSYLEYPDDPEDQAIFWVNLGEAVSN
ncbi:toll-like receptor 4 [Haliotis rufescens]|uniref:toll-like receptor 4 n=1 Tax=Haliotis rufescens TaxID=6454 RepID=UPI00201F4076|nr:toll-like receptor 4 [Haliotis rufescens]